MEEKRGGGSSCSKLFRQKRRGKIERERETKISRHRQCLYRKLWRKRFLIIGPNKSNSRRKSFFHFPPPPPPRSKLFAVSKAKEFCAWQWIVSSSRAFVLSTTKIVLNESKRFRSELPIIRSFNVDRYIRYNCNSKTKLLKKTAPNPRGRVNFTKIQTFNKASAFNFHFTSRKSIYLLFH